MDFSPLELRILALAVQNVSLQDFGAPGSPELAKAVEARQQLRTRFSEQDDEPSLQCHTCGSVNIGPM